MSRSWIYESNRLIEADAHRSSDTHLIPLHLPKWNAIGIEFYLKDESIHPTGSLKHRLARSLFLYAMCNGWIHEKSTIIEASSGSTAISEAYFARLLGLPFLTVVPQNTSTEKIQLIESFGGECHFVEHSNMVYSAAENLAKQVSGCYLDQFTFAERATDWRSNNNIAESIFHQMQKERFPIPEWIVVAAGTGGTSATLGRYIRYKNISTKLHVVDPEGSVFYNYYQTRDYSITSDGSSIEGIGRPRVEKSFLPDVIDDMSKASTLESIGAMLCISQLLGRKVGPSTGTNVIGMLRVAKEMRSRGQRGSIVSLLCDAGERYLTSYYNPEWVNNKFGDATPFVLQISNQLIS